jgi:hypothetical protein
VLPLYDKSDQEHLLRGVQQNDAGGSALIAVGFHGLFTKQFGSLSPPAVTAPYR